MKRLFTLLALAVAGVLTSHYTGHAQNNVGINTTNPNPSAALMVDTAATGPQGVLVPRMTQARRNAIASPATGLMIYQTDNTPGFYFYNGAAWVTFTGAQGAQGPQGNQGIQGNTGAQGPAGPGVPAGGTAGQVLTKVDAANYNTQWTTPSGGTPLPSQAGNAGKVLTTDGSNLSWGSGEGASYEVYATITTAQMTSVGNSLVLPDAVQFSANTSPATLTGGNTWGTAAASPSSYVGGSPSGVGSKFTANTAGLYFVDIQMVADNTNNNVPGIPMLDYNGTGNSGSSYYGTFYVNTGSTTALQSPRKGRGTLQRMVYMNAGDYFIVRLVSHSTVVGASPGVDASNYIKIVKLR